MVFLRTPKHTEGMSELKVEGQKEEKKVVKTKKELIQEFVNIFDKNRRKEIIIPDPFFTLEAAKAITENSGARMLYLTRFGLTLKKMLIHNVVQKYAEKKYRHYIRRRNINSFLTSLRAAILVNSDMLQTAVNNNLESMRKNVDDMLFPIQFHLFHKKAFAAEQVFKLDLVERAKFKKQAILGLRDDLKTYEDKVLPLVRKENNMTKEKLTTVYNDLLGKLADLEECKKLLQVEIHLDTRPLTDMAINIAHIIFDVKQNARLPIIMLLDFKEYCKMNRYYNAYKEVNKALINAGILI
jgi:hypothetical protein